MNSVFVADVEADGPIPGDFSMVSFAVIKVTPELDRMFHGRLKPISDRWVPESLAVTGHTREETLTFADAQEVMVDFIDWLGQNTQGKPILFSDNNGYDAMFLAWYLWHFVGCNPFGHSSRNLNDLYKGLQRDMRARIKKLRITPHTHDPRDDARGNAEALLKMLEMGLRHSYAV